jgi:hypothetical protein
MEVTSGYWVEMSGATEGDWVVHQIHFCNTAVVYGN